MLIERQQRLSRVRFRHPIRVVTLEGQPRVIRTLTANVSRKGLFLRMPEPLPMGTKVALSLEAGGRALALAQAEVVWGRAHESQLPGRFPGCGVRFTEFMHPRAEELVDYLVHNLDRGKPLMLAPPERRWTRWLPYAGGGALLACAALATVVLWGPSEGDPGEEEPAIALVAEPPSVHPVADAPREPPVAAAAVEAPSPPVIATGKTDEPNEPPTPVVAGAETGISPPPAEGMSQPPSPVVATAKTDAPPSAELAKEPSEPDAAPAATKQPAPPQAVKTHPSPRPSPPAGERGTVKLPSGAASALGWTLTGRELRLTPALATGAHVTHAFVLTSPPRAVFDLSGAAPLRSHVVPASPPYSTAVRLGKQAAGTRIVVDLDGPPTRVTQDGATLVLTF